MAWHRVNSGVGAYAYSHRTLVNCYLASRRKGKRADLPVGGVPDRASEPETTELRIVLLARWPRSRRRRGRYSYCATGKTGASTR